MNSPKIVVIIVTYNGLKWINRCLSELLNSTVNTNIIVIDNCSSDGTFKFIEKNFPQVTLIKSDKNLGFGKANNIGILRARDLDANFVILLNQDVYIKPETIETLVSFAEKSPEYGIISPLQLNGDASGFDLNFARILSDYFTQGFVNDLYFGKLKSVYNTKFVMAAMWLITRRCLDEVGMFEPLFNHYGEDGDYLNRVSFHGFKIGICTKAIGLHDREQRSGDLVASKTNQILNQFLVNALNLNRPVGASLLNSYIALMKNSLTLVAKLKSVGVLNFVRAGYLLIPILIARQRNKKKAGLYEQWLAIK